MKNDAMRDALESALLPAAEETGEEPEAPAEEETDVTSSEEPTEETVSEAPEGTDVPTEYFGVDLSKLDAAERAALVGEFQQRDKFIQQLLRNKPEEAAAAETSSEDDGTISDQELLAALGLDDPDDPYAETTAKVALPLAKLVLNLQEEVTSLKQTSDVERTERFWESSLTGLETKFGALPVSHDEVFKLAAEAGVGDPTDAYWRIMGPARQEVMVEVQRRREAIVKPIKDGAKGNVRPKTDAETSETPVVAKDVNEAMRLAIAKLAKERGITFQE